MAGGRVKTDCVEGYQLDHGFQVLLTAYPMARKYLNFEKLKLQKFLPGAVVFKNGRQKTLGDPLRSFSLLFPTLLSNIGSFSDKVKVLKLNRILRKLTIEEIFEEQEEPTLSFLKKFGFSSAIIEQFFRPFFSGIFLEQHLQTSSRMFKFVYKMFGEGSATIPKSGISEIPNELISRLNHTSFLYKTKVNRVEEGKVILEKGEEIKSHFTIITIDPSLIVANMKNQPLSWKSCDTLYFETETKVIHQRLIGLIAVKEALINNICYPTALQTTSLSKKELLSVTIVKEHNLDEQANMLNNLAILATVQYPRTPSTSGCRS